MPFHTFANNNREKRVYSSVPRRSCTGHKIYIFFTLAMYCRRLRSKYNERTVCGHREIQEQKQKQKHEKGKQTKFLLLALTNNKPPSPDPTSNHCYYDIVQVAPPVNARPTFVPPGAFVDCSRACIARAVPPPPSLRMPGHVSYRDALKSTPMAYRPGRPSTLFWRQQRRSCLPPDGMDLGRKCYWSVR